VKVPRSRYYRWRKPAQENRTTARHKPPRALSVEDKQQVRDVLHEDRFVDKAPTEVYAALLDESRYLCSVRTMYRILKQYDEVRERRDVLHHPNHKKPELLATGPKQVWSWDITKLKGPEKWTYFYLYVMLDIYSRHAVGWMVASKETAVLAKRLIAETCERQEIDEDQLVIHSDRGSPMTSKAVAMLMADLGVTKSLSRPHISNDNPFSESQFKTLKYCPEFPERFGSIEDARAFCNYFFNWYNNEHYHSSIALMTPAMVHYGLAAACNRSRQEVLNEAYRQHPERFVRGQPKVLVLPEAVWINPPQSREKTQETSATVDSVIIIGGV
jgi:putative transposase